jgi:hypothetical protein
MNCVFEIEEVQAVRNKSSNFLHEYIVFVPNSAEQADIFCSAINAEVVSKLV